MLRRKMFRDIKMNTGTYMSCALIIAIGIMVYMVFNIGYVNFTSSRDAYYEKNQFADVFIEGVGFPETLLNELIDLPGVQKAHGRSILDGKILTDHAGQPVYVRLVSSKGVNPELNNYEVTQGYRPGNGQLAAVADKSLSPLQITMLEMCWT